MKKTHSKVTTGDGFQFVSHLIIVTFFTFFTFSSCNDDDAPPRPVNDISDDIKALIYFKGDENASTVLINVQSGPSTEFSTDEVDLISENFNNTNLLTVNVHQAQTLNPEVLEGNDISLDQAIDLNAQSIETLYKVVHYFKAQGRTVYVLGVSFGAFVTQELIAQKGIAVADEYLIIAGRLDVNQVMVEALAQGRYGFFENGVTPVLDAEPDADVVERNLARIAAGFGIKRYTQLFSPVEDLSSITYIYGATDQAVGRLTPQEIQFLVSKNARVIAGSGNHDETINDFFVQGLYQAFGIQ